MNCIFTNNTGSDGGGLSYVNGSSNTITNSSILNNTATSSGGGLTFLIGTLTISNSTISSNTAANNGGGIYDYPSFEGQMTIINSTIANNTATLGDGGGVWITFDGTSDDDNITNTIIANNTSVTGANDLYIESGSLNTNTTNLVESCAGVIGCPAFTVTTDPNLQAATTCNGLTYLPLSASSPAINAGTTGGSVPTIDICGNARNGATDIGTSESSCAFTTAIYVNKTATGTNDGTSWANAYTNLQDAIDNQCGGIDIWVAAGTYLPTDAPDGTTSTGATDRNNAFHLATDMKIYGGFVGTETLLSQRNATTNVTILSGDFSANDIVTGAGSTLSITNNTENAYHVIITADLTSAAVIDGFTVKGGNANGSNFIIYYQSKSFSHTSGGGINNTSSSPTIKNNTIKNNNAVFGGGMDNYSSSSPTIINTTFSNNNATNGGGAINNASFSSPMIINSIFAKNNAPTGVGIGGGINNSSFSNPTITNTTFAFNSGISGGGIYNSSASSPIITNSIFWENTQNGSQCSKCC
jgi:hypothetical protein